MIRWTRCQCSMESGNLLEPDDARYQLIFIKTPVLRDSTAGELFFPRDDSKTVLDQHPENVPGRAKKVHWTQSIDHWFTCVEKTLNEAIPHLSEQGFLAISVIGRHRHYVKLMLDDLLGENHFMNEIFFGLPFGIRNPTPAGVPLFEITGSLFVYKNDVDANINPVYNSKKSGGYWHAMDSADPGPAKTFTINGEKRTIPPPPGCHWKFSQDVIDERCRNGSIRLSSTGKPQYWVKEKKGHIIDNKWFDIQATSLGSGTLEFTNDFLERILLSFTSKGDNMLHVFTDPGVMEKIARRQGVHYNEWNPVFREICAIEGGTGSVIMPLACFSGAKPCNRGSVAGVAGEPTLEVHQKGGLSLARNLFFPTELDGCTAFENRKGIDPDSSCNVLARVDNLQGMKWLLNEYRGKIKLIYIDPPYFTGIDEQIHVPLGKQEYASRGNLLNAMAFKNTMEGDDGARQFMEWFSPRVELMRELLAREGFLAVRIDYHFGHLAKLILDEMFGERHFITELLVRRIHKTVTNKAKLLQRHLINQVDSLFLYRKSKQAIVKKCPKKVKRKNGDGIETRYRCDNLWIDIAGYQKRKKTLYPTENSEILLRRVIDTFTSPGDLVADVFNGSGTTIAIANEMSRRWLGIDESAFSINETRKRLLDGDNPTHFHELSFTATSAAGGNAISWRLECRVITRGMNVIIRLTPESTNGAKGSDILDFLAVDWDNKPERGFWCHFHSNRKIGKRKRIAREVSDEIQHVYQEPGPHRICIIACNTRAEEIELSIDIDLE
ncbi:hypothetical protein GF325_04600 [Candidatus Bathyarchaeota archaeon]|nr:hypothetical protein [Candidatus Bathyarchaeota archaeon]